MTTQTNPTPSPEQQAWHAQLRMTHTFHVSLGGNEPVAGQLEATLKNSRAHVDKWLISRRGGCYEHCITVDGIGEDSARELRKALASLDGNIKVHVEHMLHFGGERH